MNEDTPFMNFWSLLNELLRVRELPEMTYGEAREWWANYQDKRYTVREAL